MLQMVFNIAIKELCRQVAVQCHERGTAIRTIFQAYVDLLNTINIFHKAEKRKIKQDFAIKLDKYI